MTVSEVKNAILKITQTFFAGAAVRFARQSFAPKASQTLVTISAGSVQRPMNPPTVIMSGRPVSFYPATMPVQIDLFTNGRQMDMGPGMTPAVENTAEDDMLAFVNYLNSPYVVNRCHELDIAIIVPRTVQDLTGLINDTNYQFRAMAEITVYFTMESAGYTGSLPMDEAEGETGYFTDVKINGLSTGRARKGRKR